MYVQIRVRFTARLKVLYHHVCSLFLDIVRDKKIFTANSNCKNIRTSDADAEKP